jgi:hypothetical protein
MSPRSSSTQLAAGAGARYARGSIEARRRAIRRSHFMTRRFPCPKPTYTLVPCGPHTLQPMQSAMKLCRPTAAGASRHPSNAERIVGLLTLRKTWQ